jgi:hypothetical protein
VSDYFDRVERQIVRNVEAGLPRSSFLPLAFQYAASAAAVAVVVVVVAVFVIAGGSGSKPTTAPASGHGLTVVLTASALDPGTPLSPATNRAVTILHERLGSVFPGVKVSRAGDNVVVTVPKAGAGSRGQILALAVPGQLGFYDWEADAITPNGKTVASQLHAQDPTALELSQGSGSTSGAPGEQGAGGMPLHQAVKLASTMPARSRPGMSRRGPEWFLFGAPGSGACATAARDQHRAPAAGAWCLLSGPVQDQSQLIAGLPAGVTRSEAQELTVPPGWVVLQAADPRTYRAADFGDPSAQFFVLKDAPALSGDGITRPQGSRAVATGQPDIVFGFTTEGGAAFQEFTRVVAERGDLVSGIGQQLNQHFAVALDDHLVTVPFIGFKQYPDGIEPGNGADIVGGFTVESARDLATILRYGVLPVRLTVTG